jgi:hypothetical protein
MRQLRQFWKTACWCGIKSITVCWYSSRIGWAFALLLITFIRLLSCTGKGRDDLLYSPRPSDQISKYVPAREDHTKQIYLITFEDPRTTVILALVAESVVRRKLKIFIWCSFPQPQLWIWAVLRKPDQEVRIYSSDLSQDERNALIDSLKQDDHEAMIAVCNDCMTSCSLILHGKCRGTIERDCPTNRAIKDQQEGRFRRVGQPKDINLLDIIDARYVQRPSGSKQS